MGSALARAAANAGSSTPTGKPTIVDSMVASFATPVDEQERPSAAPPLHRQSGVGDGDAPASYWGEPGVSGRVRGAHRASSILVCI
jgi:hypothetical protein